MLNLFPNSSPFKGWGPHDSGNLSFWSPDLSRRVETAEEIDLMIFGIPFMLLSIALEAIISHIKKLKYYDLNDALVSISHGVITDLICLKFLWPLISIYAHCWIYANYSIIKTGDSFLMSALTILLIDFGYYWMHRLAHEVNFLWATHQNLSTATRQGLFQNIFTWIFYIPCAFFVPPPLFILHKQVNTLYQFWIHTQAIGNMGTILEFVLNTPSHHRVHHGRNKPYIDKNYGGILIIWDRIFGTFEPEKEEVAYGLVHPEQHFDVVQSQLGHYISIFHQAIFKFSTFKQRFQIFFSSPGFNVETQTEYEFPTGISASNPIFNPVIPTDLKIYNIIQYISNAIIILLIVPIVSEDYSMQVKWALIGFFGIFTSSIIFQSGIDALPLEFFRLSVWTLLDVLLLVASKTIFGLNTVHLLCGVPAHQAFNFYTLTPYLFLFVLISRTLSFSYIIKLLSENMEKIRKTDQSGTIFALCEFIFVVPEDEIDDTNDFGGKRKIGKNHSDIPNDRDGLHYDQVEKTPKSPKGVSKKLMRKANITI